MESWERLPKRGVVDACYLRDGNPAYAWELAPFELKRILNRLAAYEDTGLTPVEIKINEARVDSYRKISRDCNIADMERYACAEADGRLVVLLCRVGDRVFAIFDSDDGKEISAERITEAGTRGFWTANSPKLAPDRMDKFTPWQEIGKTVFLTREEAALAKGVESDV